MVGYQCSIRSMYDEMKLCVRHMGTLSDFFNCEVGLMQGETISPLLFSLFSNDIKLFLSNKNENMITLPKKEPSLKDRLLGVVETPAIIAGEIGKVRHQMLAARVGRIGIGDAAAYRPAPPDRQTNHPESPPSPPQAVGHRA